MTNETIAVGGPWFEDFRVGQTFDAPSVTLTTGHAAIHQALFGDRLRLALDQTMAETITGAPRLLAHPAMVCNFAIGQSTYASTHVKANLFYRGLTLRRPVFIGDTLTTVTKVVALKQNSPKPGRAATGLVALEIAVTNQHSANVLHFYRCPMIACRDENAVTHRNDSLDAIPEQISEAALLSAVPKDWRLDLFRSRNSGRHFADLEVGQTFAIESRDSISSAPELARMTLNMAMTHFDAAESIYGLRLVFGGHAIAMAAAQTTRALPNILTILAWRGCDHVAPVFENDMVSTTVSVEALHPLRGGGGLVDLRARVRAERSAEAQAKGQPKDAEVLDWRFVALMA